MLGEPYVYVIVRSDIPLEFQITQACHSCLEAGFKFNKPASTCNMVIGEVFSIKDLLKWEYRLNKYNIKFEMFYEPDFGNLGYTSITTEPVYDKNRNIFKKLKLWKYERHNNI